MPETPPSTPPSVRRPAVIYFALFFAVGTAFPYFSVFYQSAGLTVEGVGVVAAAVGLVAVIAAPVWGAVVDRLRDARGPLLAAGLWGAIAAVWLAFSRDPAMVLTAAAVLSAGTLTCGAVFRTTFTPKLAEEWLPEASVAVQVTVVWPTGIVEPLAGAHTTAGDGSTASVAVGFA